MAILSLSGTSPAALLTSWWEGFGGPVHLCTTIHDCHPAAKVLFLFVVLQAIQAGGPASVPVDCPVGGPAGAPAMFHLSSMCLAKGNRIPRRLWRPKSVSHGGFFLSCKPHPRRFVRALAPISTGRQGGWGRGKVQDSFLPPSHRT